MKHSQRYNDNKSKIDRFVEYEVDEAFDKLKSTSNAKFNETVEVAVNLGVDPRHADQIVRGTCSLPHGTGKVVRVLVLAKGPKQEEAKNAGADYVGLEDYVEKIQSGWTDVDAIVATPDVMGIIGKLGRVLGPRGLMPNPKSGTVTMDVAEAVQAVKGGRIDFRTDKFGILHAVIGKSSFEKQQLIENLQEFIRTVLRLKPPVAKGQYVKNVTICSTLGPGVKINRAALLSSLK
ncbi:50S ribosomal protein L1 [bacterium]|nr:50S ribosomal protein L1 [bacterium]MBU1650637.1 50S ribosomal protein L1 [bacterium]